MMKGCNDVIPEFSQEVQSLLCLFDISSGVATPGQVVLYVDTQKQEVNVLLSVLVPLGQFRPQLLPVQ